MARHKPKPVSQIPVTAVIESLNHEGRGVAHVDGKVVFVDGALPGETVRFVYSKRHKRHDDAKVLEVLSASPERVEPRCTHFGICGGCALQHMDASAQLRAKQQVLLDSLRHIGKIEPATVLVPLTGPQWGYRRKARLGVKYLAKKGRLLIGFRERGESVVADLHGCDILHPSIAARIDALNALISALQGFDRITQIEVAVGDAATALVFRNMVALCAADLDRLKSFGIDHSMQIYLQPAGPDSITLLWPERADLSYALPTHSVELHFAPNDFTQVNMQINRAMVDRTLELLAPEPDDKVLDLFCGLGNFTLPLARRAREVVGVEGDAGLIRRAQDNARRNGIDNTQFHVADLSGDIGTALWRLTRYDKILLDPPRTGALELLPQIAKLGARRIVYVSCNPATLARDAGLLVHDHGYKLLCAGVMDMFPHTAHVESIALFERNWPQMNAYERKLLRVTF